MSRLPVERMIRCAIKDSEAFNKLNWREQIFFVRLMLSVDDYGRFEARAEALRAAVFPLSASRVPVRDVWEMVLRCRELRLVELYTVEGKGYGRVLKFRQRLKFPKGRHPAAPSEQGELALGLESGVESSAVELSESAVREVFEPKQAKKAVRNRSPERVLRELREELKELAQEINEIERPGGAAWPTRPTGEKLCRYEKLVSRRTRVRTEIEKLEGLIENEEGEG